MAIKQIQLRGISRTPSDRMNEDGGVAESLNIQTDQSELAPILPPEDVTEKAGLPLNFEGEVLYIHKGSNYVNNIVQVGRDIKAYTKHGVSEIFSLGEGENILSMTSLGNSLVIASDQQMTYALFIDNAYKYLGHKIPFPSLEVGISSKTTEARTIHYDASNTEGFGSNLAYGLTSLWNSAKIGAQDVFYDQIAVMRSMVQDIRSEYDYVQDYNEAYCRPLFVRYALSLYDGSEILSEPVLMQDRKESAFGPLRGEVYYDANGYRTATVITATFYSLFGLRMQPVTMSEIEELKDNWADIVKNIRVYASLDIEQAEIKTVSSARVSNWQEVPTGVGTHKVTCDIELTEPYIDRKELLSRGEFFLIDELGLSDFDDAYYLGLPFLSDTERATKPGISQAIENGRDVYWGENVISYNGRVILSGVKKKLAPPSQTFQGSLSYVGASDPFYSWSIKCYYRIMPNNGDTVILEGAVHGAEGASHPMSYISYPSRNCRNVYLLLIHDGDHDFFELSVAESTAQDLACFYNTEELSLLHLLKDVLDGNKHSGITLLNGNPIGELKDVMEESHKIYMTKANNFYVYESSLGFSDEVLCVATATRALSAGQFGHFPLIVFTTGGIWSVALSDDGAFASSTPLSREVALRGCIWPIDQAIVFATDKGVMLLSGSDIISLSPNMNGKHYVLESSAADLLSQKADWSGLLTTVSDGTPFMAFMKEAHGVYDYAGNRLIFFKPDESYQYIYKLDTQTWHKMQLPDGCSFSNTLNSYPEAQVVLTQKVKVPWGYLDNMVYMVEGEAQSAYVELMASTKEKMSEQEWVTWMTDETCPYKSLLGFTQEEIEDMQNVCLSVGGFQLVVDEFNEEYTRLYDYSTMLDIEADATKELSGIIVTRPFDLGEPDILKTINHLKIRGSYERYDSNGKPRVSYILLGSQDGIHFHRLGSLRGKSWKMFRMVILSKLRPTERISWIDIDYESRFTNKLR